MSAAMRNLARWKTTAKYGNFNRFVSSFTSPSTGDPTPPSTSVDLEEIEAIIKNRNKDMPVPDMTNPYERERQLCVLCKYGVQLEYKNAKLLSQFVSPITGRIYSKHVTKLCSEQYARLEKCVRMSRQSGYMPYMHKDLDFVHDPKLFDANTK